MMDIRKPTTTIEVWGLIRKAQHYREIWIQILHVLGPLTKVASRAIVSKILQNNNLEVSFKDINQMVSDKILTNHPYLKIHSL